MVSLLSWAGMLIAYRKAFPGVTLDLRELTTDVQLDMS